MPRRHIPGHTYNPGHRHNPAVVILQGPPTATRHLAISMLWKDFQWVYLPKIRAEALEKMVKTQNSRGVPMYLLTDLDPVEEERIRKRQGDFYVAQVSVDDNSTVESVAREVTTQLDQIPHIPPTIIAPIRALIS